MFPWLKNDPRGGLKQQTPVAASSEVTSPEADSMGSTTSDVVVMSTGAVSSRGVPAAVSSVGTRQQATIGKLQGGQTNGNGRLTADNKENKHFCTHQDAHSFTQTQRHMKAVLVTR